MKGYVFEQPMKGNQFLAGDPGNAEEVSSQCRPGHALTFLHQTKHARNQNSASENPYL